MKKVLVVGLVAGLSACSAPNWGVVATRVALPAETVGQITRYCGLGSELILVARAFPNESARKIGEFVGNYCDELTRGQLPRTTDANTVNWLAENLAALKGLLGR